jgi:hypothetical protein
MSCKVAAGPGESAEIDPGTAESSQLELPAHTVAVVTPRKLWFSTLLALLVALLILITVVLPAEFGIDPTGTGRLLGLTRIGQLKALSGGSGAAVMHDHPRKYLSARIEIRLEGGAELEYKAQLARGEPLLYAWSVLGSTVHFEFHGEPTEGRWPKDFYQSYQTADRSTGAQGSFIAPFTGRHGWYWRNETSEPATIVLEASGYYTRLERIEGGGAQ